MTPADATLIVLLGGFAIIPLWIIAAALTGIRAALEVIVSVERFREMLWETLEKRR